MRTITPEQYQKHLKFVQQYEAENEVPVEAPKVKRYVLATADPVPQNMQQVARQLFDAYDAKKKRHYHKPVITDNPGVTMQDVARTLKSHY